MRTVSLLEATKAAFYNSLIYINHNPQLSKQYREMALVAMRAIEQNILIEHNAFLEASYYEVCRLLFKTTAEELRELTPLVFVRPEKGEYCDKEVWGAANSG